MIISVSVITNPHHIFCLLLTYENNWVGILFFLFVASLEKPANLCGLVMFNY